MLLNRVELMQNFEWFRQHYRLFFWRKRHKIVRIHRDYALGYYQVEVYSPLVAIPTLLEANLAKQKNTPAQVSLQYYQATHHTNFVFNCLLYGIMSTEIRIIWYIKMTRKNNYKKTVSGSSKPQKRKKNLVFKVCLA